MNRKQKFCLWAGIVAIVLMNLFPPWIAYQSIPKGDIPIITLRKYVFIFKAPYTKYGVYNEPVPEYMKDSDWLSVSEIDITRLIIQCFIVALLTAGLVFTFKKKDQRLKDEQKQ